ncbi:TetR/AcrR family transcriptional regulator [Ruminococcus sp.]|uniref:TetR/AcrR family transcriptional regulator n=1 Tax=Ruminococcus sp. TaxID=41978 RepID=UPI0025EDC3F3|nr:TetR/AcrR family transcriptional regulator [Ruminococcus sp.]MBQ8967809.1 TetR/AcrR family transcriptional regulator [Ruminococcus sp.]
MDTKEKILDAAMSLFSEKGYADVFMAEIAERVGIKAPSIYKHYKGKKEIFEAILAKMKQDYDKQAAALSIDGNDAAADGAVYLGKSEEEILKMGMGLFMYFIHDEYVCKFRKMLTVQQFNDKELAEIFSAQYADDPLNYQSALFALLMSEGAFKEADPAVTALQFYGPLFMLMTMYDRQPEREQELAALAEKHIRQFTKLYRKEEKS